MIKITPIEQEKKFKPFSITLDIENETQAALIYAVLLMFSGNNSRKHMSYLSLEQDAFHAKYIREYKEYIEEMMKPVKKLSKQ